MEVYNPKTLPFPQGLLEEVKELLQKSQRIVIISHRNPDGDTIGANLALKHALTKQWGKEVISACVDPLPEYALILRGSYEYVNDFDLSQVDLLMSVDCGAHYLLKFHEKKPEILEKKIPFINIDHHPSNDYFGTHNLVHDTAAAASFTVYHLLNYLEFAITPEIASALMMGIYYDTGSLMHSNTKPEVLEASAELLAKGADHQQIVQALFHSTTVNKLRLWGRVMSRARLNKRQAVVSAVTEKDFVECEADPEDLSGVIDLLNSVPEGKFAILLNEDRKGNIKGSLRTHNDQIDLSKLASLFGGGGHKKAAGFTVPGKLQKETTWKIETNPLL